MPPALSESRKTGTPPASGPAWKLATIASRCRTGVPPWRNWWGIPARDRWSSTSRAIATYWVKTSTELSSARAVAEQLVEQVELLRAPGQAAAGLLEEVGRVVADLLEPGEQLEHQAAAGLLVGALDAGHRVAHERLVEDHLLAGQPEQVVGLGLVRQLGRDAGVGLAATQEERADQAGELPSLGRLVAGLDRAGPDLAERLAAAEQAGGRPVEDRPELGQVVLDGGAGEGDPRGDGHACAEHGPSPTGRS